MKNYKKEDDWGQQQKQSCWLICDPCGLLQQVNLGTWLYQLHSTSKSAFNLVNVMYVISHYDSISVSKHSTVGRVDMWNELKILCNTLLYSAHVFHLIILPVHGTITVHIYSITP